MTFLAALEETKQRIEMLTSMKRNEQHPFCWRKTLFFFFSSHLECNSELFQWLLMEVVLVKEQQQLKNTPVRTKPHV